MPNISAEKYLEEFHCIAHHVPQVPVIRAVGGALLPMAALVAVLLFHTPDGSRTDEGTQARHSVVAFPISGGLV